MLFWIARIHGIVMEVLTKKTSKLPWYCLSAINIKYYEKFIYITINKLKQSTLVSFVTL